MKKKTCIKCKVKQSISQFYPIKNTNKHVSYCKTCMKEYRKNYTEYNKIYQKEWHKQNLEKHTLLQKEWYINNKDKHSKMMKEWNSKNKDKVNAINREKCKDPAHKAKKNLRRRILHVLKNNTKSASTIELLGCSIEEFMIYMENKFLDGMSWDNHGVHGWHIDHIKPCASFDLTDPEQQKKCFNYTNLQPLWAKDNLKKSNKY